MPNHCPIKPFLFTAAWANFEPKKMEVESGRSSHYACSQLVYTGGGDTGAGAAWRTTAHSYRNKV